MNNKGLTQAQKDYILSRDIDDEKFDVVIHLFMTDESFKQAILDVLSEPSQMDREGMLIRLGFLVKVESMSAEEAIEKNEARSPRFEITELMQKFCSFVYYNKIFFTRCVPKALWTEISWLKASVLRTLIEENALIDYENDQSYKEFDLKSRSRANELRKSGDLIDE